MMGIQGGAFINNLNALGVTVDEITDVLFTHLHSDHIGWAVTNGSSTFANANLRASQADVDHFVHGSGADETESEVLDIIGTHIVPWTTGSTTTIVPGIDQFAAPGHTPGSSVIVVSSDTERALLLGDVVHCPIQLIDDEWAGLFDVDPVLARKTRNALSRELEGDSTVASGAHFPGMQFGRLLRGKGRRFWQLK
jgi:glyoxylase-like metal-dependent hydrolase (beta-lactamase superfamily II)